MPRDYDDSLKTAETLYAILTGLTRNRTASSRYPLVDNIYLNHMQTTSCHQSIETKSDAYCLLRKIVSRQQQPLLVSILWCQQALCVSFEYLLTANPMAVMSMPLEISPSLRR